MIVLVLVTVMVRNDIARSSVCKINRKGIISAHNNEIYIRGIVGYGNNSVYIYKKFVKLLFNLFDGVICSYTVSVKVVNT